MSINRSARWRRSTAEVDQSGFTLIELLIVIVVLGILAAIVVFSLQGATSSSVISACSADSRTVNIAVQAAETDNPTSYPGYNGAASTSAQWQTALTGSSLTGGPFLQSWPGQTGYAISVAGSSAAATTGDSPAVSPSNGDVIVTAGGKTYDFSVDGNSACAAA